ncbi:MAG: acyl-CoA dehydrogenase family protein [bacterium]|nr:acyl-CoA dehydrogenase family protein [bacterium]
MRISDENRALQQMAREFAEKEIRPIAAERDKITNPKETFSWELVKKGSALGLRTLAVPEEFGGPGVDLMGQVLVILELARADGGVAKTFSQCWKWTPMIAKLANDEQRKRFLPLFMNDDTYLLAMGGSEPDAGSDNRIPPPGYPKAGWKTSAVRKGDSWVLNGMKHFIANGGVASLYIIRTRTNPDVPITEGTTMFFVPKDTPGFSIGRTHDKIGWRFYQNAELIFQDCQVPHANVLGEVNKGKGSGSERYVSFNDVELAANVLGIAQSAFEYALDHARNRIQGGKPIIEHQAIALKLADMHMRLEAARSYLFNVVENAENAGEEFESSSKQLMKVFATEAAISVAQNAVEIFGGSGVMRDAPVEKLLRDVAIFPHLAADSVMKLRAAAKLR